MAPDVTPLPRPIWPRPYVPERDDEPPEAAPTAPVVPIVHQRAAEPAAPYPTMDDVELDQLPDPVMLVDRMFTTDSVVLAYGKYGSYKTFVALAVAFAVQTGTPLWGRTVVQGDALYLFAEGRAGFKKRLRALKRLHGLDHVGMRFLCVAPKLTDPAEVARVVATVRAMPRKPKVIVIDTKERHIGGDENAQKDMGLFVNACHALRDAAEGAMVLVVDHSGYDGQHNRGSTVLASAADTELRLTRKFGETRVTVECMKQRDLEEFPTFALELHTVVGTGSSVLLPAPAESASGQQTDDDRVLEAIRAVQPAALRAIYRAVRARGSMGTERIDDARERLDRAALIRYATIDGKAGWCVSERPAAIEARDARGTPEIGGAAEGAGRSGTPPGRSGTRAGHSNGTGGLASVPVSPVPIGTGTGTLSPDEGNREENLPLPFAGDPVERGPAAAANGGEELL
jgi:hypothetical protein